MEPAAAGHVEHDDPDDREQGRGQPAVELQVEDQLRRDGRPLRRQDARCEPAREVLRAAKKPMRGSSLVIFWKAAVVVTVTSHASGRPGTQAWRSRPDLTKIAVTTASAMAASIWFAIPNSGHRMLMPPFGSSTPM